MLRTLIQKCKGESCTLERLHTQALNDQLEYENNQGAEQEEEDKEEKERVSKSSRREVPDEEPMDQDQPAASRNVGK